MTTGLKPAEFHGRIGALTCPRTSTCRDLPNARKGKGEALNAILEAHKPPVAVFVDDLSYQHHSVAKAAPQVWRLHMVAEPLVAQHRPKATDAHARIDDWAEAADWILARFADGQPAPLTATADEA